MNRYERLMVPITFLLLFAVASPASAGLFRRGHRRCQAPCQVPCQGQESPPPQAPAPAPDCTGRICPQYTTETRAPGSTDTVLWYAIKCGTGYTPVPWYGPYNHEKWCTCLSCQYCEGAYLTQPERGLEFYATKSVADGGIVMRDPQLEKEFLSPKRNFSSRIVKFRYKGEWVVAQLIHIEHRPNETWKWATTEFGREVKGDPAAVPEKDTADKQPFHGKRLVVIQTKEGGVWQVMLDRKRPEDTRDKE